MFIFVELILRFMIRKKIYKKYMKKRVIMKRSSLKKILVLANVFGAVLIMIVVLV